MTWRHLSSPESGLARRFYAYAFLNDFVLLYPVYAVLFAETGLSAAEISSLFAIWSVTGFVLEVPSGAWADTFSRRRLLALAPILTGTGFALWTFVPSYASFAVGFVLWGAGSAMQSGTEEALVYEELARAGAAGAFARLIGRAEAVSTLAQLFATLPAGLVLAAGGYHAVGLASVAVTLLAAAAGRSRCRCSSGWSPRGTRWAAGSPDAVRAGWRPGWSPAPDAWPPVRSAAAPPGWRSSRSRTGSSSGRWRPRTPVRVGRRAVPDHRRRAVAADAQRTEVAPMKNMVVPSVWISGIPPP